MTSKIEMSSSFSILKDCTQAEHAHTTQGQEQKDNWYAVTLDSAVITQPSDGGSNKTSLKFLFSQFVM